jgi:hypothetical protein
MCCRAASGIDFNDPPEVSLEGFGNGRVKTAQVILAATQSDCNAILTKLKATSSTIANAERDQISSMAEFAKWRRACGLGTSSPP